MDLLREHPVLAFVGLIIVGIIVTLFLLLNRFLRIDVESREKGFRVRLVFLRPLPMEEEKDKDRKAG